MSGISATSSPSGSRIRAGSWQRVSGPSLIGTRLCASAPMHSVDSCLARLCYGLAMAHLVCPVVSAEDRERLAAVGADRNRPQKHVARARIILASAERLEVAEVARRARISRPAVW